MRRDILESSGTEYADAELEELIAPVLRLHITGTTPRATRAIVNIRTICEEHLHGRYALEIVDIARNPPLAQGEQIIAAPTLIKKLPLPLRRFIGDMSHTEKILLGLDLREKGTKPE